MKKILFYNFNPKSVRNAHLGFFQLGYEFLELKCNIFHKANEELKQELTEVIETFKPDLVFSYGWWLNRVDIDFFCNFLQKKGVFHVYWAFDDPDCFLKISLPIGKKCDLLFTTDINCIDKYKENNVEAHLLLHGCYPPKHYKKKSVEKFKHDIVLMANNYNVKWDKKYFSYRFNGIKNVIKPIVEKNYDLMVWGLWWTKKDRIYTLPKKNYNEFVPYGREAEIYSSSKIGLGLQTVGNSNTQFSVRTFEVLACGIFHLSQYSPALEYCFKKGVHMEWTKSPEETLSLVNYYLKNKDQRKKIALRGQQEVYEKHRLKHRAERAMDIINKHI
jgi:spore maturation protein CgeB